MQQNEFAKTHPPVLDHLTLLNLRPLGHLMFRPLTLPPVQKYFCLSLATKPKNSLSFALLSIEIGFIPLARQKLAAWLCVNEVQPRRQDTR